MACFLHEQASNPPRVMELLHITWGGFLLGNNVLNKIGYYKHSSHGGALLGGGIATASRAC